MLGTAPLTIYSQKMNYKISHPTKIIKCEINLPTSKSISNRLLIIKSLCKKRFKIKNLSNSQDTITLQKILNNPKKNINVGAAGTPLRFLTSYLAQLKDKEFILRGSERMNKRPIKELVQALNILGAKVSYIDKEGFSPIKIIGKDIAGGKVKIDGSISSQFISSLLLIAPTLKKGLEIDLLGKIVSKPYIEMTLNIMNHFGIKSSWIKNKIKIENQKYIEKEYSVEPDWSAASFWFEIAALSDRCKIKLNNLSTESIQGDSKILSLFSNLSVSSSFKEESLIIEKDQNLKVPNKINIINNSDIYQPLRCTLHGLGIETNITGTQTLKNKETGQDNCYE